MVFVTHKCHCLHKCTLYKCEHKCRNGGCDLCLLWLFVLQHMSWCLCINKIAVEKCTVESSGEVDAEKGKGAEKVDVDNMVGLSAH